jgi:hypothetical protein
MFRLEVIGCLEVRLPIRFSTQKWGTQTIELSSARCQLCMMFEVNIRLLAFDLVRLSETIPGA